MAFRRRRRPRVVWLPNPGTRINTTLTNGEQYAELFFNANLLLGANHNPTVEFPLVIDNPDTLLAAVGAFNSYQKQTLIQEQSYGYRLRRIVGKIHCAVDQLPGAQPPTLSTAISVTAGIIVRRVDSAGNAVASGTDSSTQSIQNIQDPWIWRRNWMLSTGIAGGGLDAAFNNAHFTQANIAIGGNADGPHIDQKTARRIGPEERLFLDVSYVTLGQLEGQDEQEESVNVGIHMDYRILATLITNTGNRRNAVR